MVTNKHNKPLDSLLVLLPVLMSSGVATAERIRLSLHPKLNIMSGAQGQILS